MPPLSAEDTNVKTNKETNHRILFIGNSFTARNGLPDLIAQLAAAHGKAIEHRLISAGGASLRRHWNAGEALHAIQTGHFDHVVLQEQSTLPIKNPTRMHESVRLFDASIKAARATTVLYMTWARLSAPESQQAITDAYISIGRELGATVAPVGLAWQRFLREHNTPALHDRDQSHPALAGSYLAACVFVAVLLKRSPVDTGAGIRGLTGSDRLQLEKAAWQTVLT
jgi:hypothetical protein